MATSAPLPRDLGSLVQLRVQESGDEELARLVARASEPAFAAIYDRHHQALYRYCRSILRDESDAQDALQSTWTRALVALRRGQRDAPLRPWLYRIAHNESVSLLRRRRLRVVSPDAEADADHAASAEQRVIEREQLAQLVDDLHALPTRQRGALLMRELSGLSHEEIAAALQISVSAAKQCIYEARRELAEYAAGRATPCEEICRRVSDGDRRALRARRVRAHLRGCSGCAGFAASMDNRAAALHQLAPWLSAAAATAMLHGVLHSARAGAARAATGGVGGSAVGGSAAAPGGVGGSGAATGAASSTGAGAVGGTPVAVATKSIGLSLLAKSLLATVVVTGGVAAVASVKRAHHHGAAPPALSAATLRSPTATPAPAPAPATHPRPSSPPAAHPAARPPHHGARTSAGAVSHRVPPPPAAGGRRAGHPAPPARSATTAGGQAVQPRRTLAPGQLKKAAQTPAPQTASPGQLKKASPVTPPPGRLKKSPGGGAPPGQLKKAPPADRPAATPATPPPGQVKKAAGAPPPGHGAGTASSGPAPAAPGNGTGSPPGNSGNAGNGHRNSGNSGNPGNPGSAHGK